MKVKIIAALKKAGIAFFIFNWILAFGNMTIFDLMRI